jgi:hypothetical protein
MSGPSGTLDAGALVDDAEAPAVAPPLVGAGASPLAPAAVVAGVLALSVVVLQSVAGEYLLARGFPLDDSWIHAVYARELARTGTLAFNPGVAATGETSPLWAIVLAPVYLVASQTATAVALTKIVGLVLHGCSVFLLAYGLVRRFPESRPEILFASAITAGHPDLVAASVSGMEVPLATCVIAGAAVATLNRSTMGVALAGALAFAARPETAAIAVVLPLLFWLRTEPRFALRLAASGFAGAVLSMGVLSVRNHAVTGMYLPATFHAKVNVGPEPDRVHHALRSQLGGFADMLGYMPLFGFAQVTAIAAMTSLTLVASRAVAAVPRLGGTLFLSGVAYCGISFFLVEPIDPNAFYHQRYALPGVFLMTAALLLIVGGIVRHEPRLRLLLPVAVVTMAVPVALAAPARFTRIASDARNIDDVQVAMGKWLASSPATDNAWVVDVGAVRFFGSAYIVDLVGLNSPELLGRDAQKFLDAHPPKYIDIFKSWSDVARANAVMPARVFQTTTPYTVATYEPMRQHVVLTCEPGVEGRIETRRGKFDFRCAR